MSAPKSPVHLPSLFVLLALKLIIHLFAILNDYGLHRDEYLYLAEGDHPLWGYMEGPPIIGWVAAIGTGIFGDSIWAAKLPVLLVGLFSIWVLLKLTTELGGDRFAQLLAGMAWVLSPVFLGSNHLFQPVSFNQFCWLLVAYQWVRIINYRRSVDYYWLGLAIGVGLLTKYSIVFFLIALFGGALLTPQRKLMLQRDFLVAAGIALLLWLPNLYWQWTLEFPVLLHMRELAATQLVNMTASDFLVPQLLYHFVGTIVWVAGLLFLLALLRPSNQEGAKSTSYRSLGYAYLILLLLLLFLNGKAYYTFGSYSMLFAAGGVYWSKRLGRRALLILPAFLFNLPMIPLAIPVLGVEKMQSYGIYLRDEIGFDDPLRWEDGRVRDLKQDYADMLGWEEMVARVAEFYHGLSPYEKEETLLYGGSYGQAGALNFYRDKYNLPLAHSFSASYLLWVPANVDFERMILVDNRQQEPSEWFARDVMVDSVITPMARERHYIYYRSDPREDVSEVWKGEILEMRREQLGAE